MSLHLFHYLKNVSLSDECKKNQGLQISHSLSILLTLIWIPCNIANMPVNVFCNAYCHFSLNIKTYFNIRYYPNWLFIAHLLQQSIRLTLNPQAWIFLIAFNMLQNLYNFSPIQFGTIYEFCGKSCHQN